ncbi:Tfp pilus assembly protein PilF [Pacificitalea manganoxidans]|nr:Tfp pilus assembly protein PilF [Pacificitalea manganoxidans]
MFDRPGSTVLSKTWKISRAENEKSIETSLENCRRAWRLSGEPQAGEELLAIAFIAGRELDRDVQNAAFQVASDEESGPLMRALANNILDGAVHDTSDGFAHQAATIREDIRKRKILLRLNPRDGLLLAETALLHTNLGQGEKSRVLLKRAAALAPNSRYVLRSAARFYCHIDKPDQALALLQRSPRHQTDPWLKSAELAISSICGRPITQWRQSKTLAEDKALSVLDRSELAAELATLEFEAGGRRAALKKIKLAAGNPTENAAAQVEFLAERTRDFSREDVLPDISGATEARALSCYWKGELRSALDACEEWQELEPFSVRPAIFGSFLSTARMNTPIRGIALAQRGLASNPGNSALLNNLSVLHAYQGDIPSAKKFAERARQTSEDKNDIANMATRGLILFREGKADQGASEYQKAMDRAVESRRADLYLRAYAFLARELCRIDPHVQPVVLQEINKAEKIMNKRNRQLPREVALMREEFATDEMSSAELLLDFAPLSTSDVERALDL